MAPFDAPGSAPALVPDELRRELQPGERLLWSGRPAGGLRLQASDAAVTAFALPWCAVGAAWWGSASEADGSGLAWLPMVPILLVGLYLLLGRFFHDAWRRGRTLHAVTSRRILTVVGAGRRAVTSTPLASLAEPVLREGRSGLGTITFPASPPPPTPFEDTEHPAGLVPSSGPRLALLPDARRALQAIQAARSEAAAGRARAVERT